MPGVAAVGQHRALELGVEAVDEQDVRDGVVVADHDLLEAVGIDAGWERVGRDLTGVEIDVSVPACISSDRTAARTFSMTGAKN